MPSHGRPRTGRHLRAVVLTVVVVFVPAAGGLGAWHSHSHEIAAKTAVHSMPADAPEFFRLADEEIAYVCNDPDRWRANNADPTLRANASGQLYLGVNDDYLADNRGEFRVRIETPPRRQRR